MFPFFYIFGKKISVYAVLALSGIFASAIFICLKTKKHGYNENDIIILLLVSAAGVFLGGHLFYGIINAGHFRGQVFYGGLLGGLAAGLLYGKWKFAASTPGISALTDLLTPAIPLFHFFGRIGCFMAGCCFGIESRFGFTFHNSVIAGANGVNRLPVQIIESLFNLVLFAALQKAASGRKSHLEGKLLFVYLLSYSAGRFFLEFFRGDESRGFWGPLSVSQWISIILASFALVKLWKPVIASKKSRIL